MPAPAVDILLIANNPDYSGLAQCCPSYMHARSEVQQRLLAFSVQYYGVHVISQIA